MKRLWDCRRTFLCALAMVGLFLDMDKNPTKDHSLEIVGLAGTVAAINANENKKKAELNKPTAVADVPAA